MPGGRTAPEAMDITTALANTNRDFRCVCLGHDGIIYALVPGANGAIWTIDKETGNAIKLFEIGNCPGTYVDIIPAENGKLYAIPFSAATVIEIDIKTQTVAHIGDLGTSNQKFQTSTLASNGCIYLIPYNHNKIIEVDVHNKTVIGVADRPAQLVNCALMRDGFSIFCYQRRSKTAWIFDTQTKTFTRRVINTNGFNVGNFHTTNSIVLLPDGNIGQYCDRTSYYAEGLFEIIDTTTFSIVDTFSTPNLVISGDWGGSGLTGINYTSDFESGLSGCGSVPVLTLLRNGTVLIYGTCYYGSIVGTINYKERTASRIVHSYSGSTSSSGIDDRLRHHPSLVVDKDGDVFCFANRHYYNKKSWIVKFNLPDSPKIETILSPFVKKGSH